MNTISKNGNYTQVRIVLEGKDDSKTFSITFHCEIIHSIGVYWNAGESALFSPTELENAIALAKKEFDSNKQWTMIRPGVHTRGEFRIERIQYSEMTTRPGCFKTGWEIQKNKRRWYKEPFDTLKEAKEFCEDQF